MRGATAAGVSAAWPPEPQSLCSPRALDSSHSVSIVSPPLGVQPKARLGTEIHSLAVTSLVGEKRPRKAQKPLP